MKTQQQDKLQTCRIKWIDDNGRTTEDTNPAVGVARCLGYFVPENPSYRPEPSEWFPICAQHLHTMIVGGFDRWEYQPHDVRPVTA